MLNIDTVSTLELARVLAVRPDLETLLREDGLLPKAIWSLRKSLGVVACADSFAVRRKDGVWEGGVIRRGTGPYAGKLALIGGVVALGETVEEALRRHWRTDLGVEITLPIGWRTPLEIAQYAPKVNGSNRPDFGDEPTKHALASTHLVEIVGGDSARLHFGENDGGQEACDLCWFSLENIPAYEEWGYDMGPVFRRCMALVPRLMGL